MKIKYLLAKSLAATCGKILGGGGRSKIMKRYFAKQGIRLGDNCAIYSDITSSESYLINIGDRVTISNGVQLITHDNAIDRFSLEKSDIFGEIRIGNDCFIGAKSIILPGVTLVDKTIVGAGSVVTKSVLESGKIIAGNPAREIGTIADYLAKYEDVAFGKELLNGRRKTIELNKERVFKNK